MEFTAWLSLAIVCIIGAVSPGPSLIVILRHSIYNSTRHGIVAAVSHGIGVGLYALATIIGLSTVIIAFPMFYTILVYGGAAYLLYMAYRAFTASKTSKIAPESTHQQESMWRSAQDAFAIAFLNPKLAIFFVALFSQFIQPENLTLMRAVIMVLTVFAIDAIWYICVACMVGVSRQKIDFTKHNRLIDQIAAVVFVLLATRILFI